MLPIELSIPLGIGTPAWPTYEPLQMKYFKRLAPNGANGQLLTHSNHLGTHLDGEIHFYSPGKDMAALPGNESPVDAGGQPPELPPSAAPGAAAGMDRPLSAVVRPIITDAWAFTTPIFRDWMRRSRSACTARSW